MGDQIRRAGHASFVAAALGAVLAMSGIACSSSPANGRAELDSGEVAINDGNYEQAIHQAESVIAMNSPSTLAESRFLRGLAIEERSKPNKQMESSDLEAASREYHSALDEKPSPPLEARLHAQLGTVAYFQEDYASALHELTLAYDHIDQAELKAKVLYRVGVCQQRLDRFTDADRTFQQVQRNYPDSQYAQSARAHEGVHAFRVQLGPFNDPNEAERALRALQGTGSVPQRIENAGHTVVQSSELQNFEQATALKSRLSAQYPDAQISP